jgi:hypothetical protein
MMPFPGFALCALRTSEYSRPAPLSEHYQAYPKEVMSVLFNESSTRNLGTGGRDSLLKNQLFRGQAVGLVAELDGGQA